MAVRVVRLGASRQAGEGLRIGTVRRPPRGIRKEDYGRRNYFDVWMPDLAPTAPLVSWFLSGSPTDRRWLSFTRKYWREMREPRAARLISLLAALSRQTDFSVGCYCEDENRCHRSLLATLLKEAGAEIRR